MEVFMKINEVIRKHRKEKNMTQEEMANRLGVTAPAVNKWESGASMPDISLLAPIARLLNVSLDELLSFKEELSEIEVSSIIKEIYEMFDTEPIEAVYHRILEVTKEYPNAESLLLSLVGIFDSRCVILGEDSNEEYNKWIQGSYQNLLFSHDEEVRVGAAGGLYALYIRKEMYEDAERCLSYFSAKDPDRKRKLATIYYGKGQYEEAYKTLEAEILSNYQTISVMLLEIFMVAVKTENFEKAKAIIEKESAFAELFEMGEYHKNAGRLELAVALKDSKETLRILDSLLSNTNTVMDYTKSKLFEHMTFQEVNPALFQTLRVNTLKHFSEDDNYKFVRESEGWEAFEKKWMRA